MTKIAALYTLLIKLITKTTTNMAHVSKLAAWNIRLRKDISSGLPINVVSQVGVEILCI